MKNRYKNLFLHTKNIERSSYVWNAVAGIIFAMQSAVMLMVIMRTNGIDDSGVFSIAYAVAGMMSFIGEFGVRKYQASDVGEVNLFSDYYTFRLMSCAAMIIACAMYAGWGLIFRDYTLRKFLVIMMVSVVKLVEAFVDVFYGRFQQKWRLDVAAKTNSFRIMFGMICCMVSLVITHDLLISCVVWALAVIAGMELSTMAVASEFCEIRVRFNKAALLRIFRECFPLFIGAFLLLYVGNAPKYAIDAFLDDASQANFNFIFMPVFVIGMLANFIFNPVLVRMADEWDKGRFREFHRMVYKQIGVILGLTVLAVAVALTIGCPVLGLLYHTDLGGFKAELVILMIGGGMLALVNFFSVVVTVIRYQKHLAAGYIAVALIAWAMSGFLVRGYGIMGAAVLYAALMTVLAGVFALILVICERAGRKKRC